MEINPLIAIPSPRDMEEVIKAFSSITEYDKLWLKYMPEYVAYPKMREKFLDHPTEYYTHLIICPDDLFIDDKNKIKLLLDHYDKSLEGDEKHNTIISGYCNVDQSTFSKYANVSRTPVSNIRKGREYDWISLDAMDSMRRSPANIELLEVKFAGFPLFVIPRNIVEQIPFRNDAASGKFEDGGCCVDVMFCNDAREKLGTKIYVDVRVRLNHLKIDDYKTGKLLSEKPQGMANQHLFFEYAEHKNKRLNF